MYVRKFESDTLEGALKAIKSELGPDAIILKTVTNKGLKKAFKKKKIEITAAISEKNYLNKIKVDGVLDEKQKEEFYSADAEHVSKMINQGEPSIPSTSKTAGYGNIGLNRQVNTKGLEKSNTGPAQPNLDDFLNASNRSTEFDHNTLNEGSPQITEDDFDKFVEENSSQNSEDSVVVSEVPEGGFAVQESRIDALEHKLYQLTKSVDERQNKEPVGIYQLRTTLRSLDVSEGYVQKLIRKSLFDLSESDLASADVVFEYALQEMLAALKIEMPLFSTSDSDKYPVVTVLLSETSCGQTNMMLKLGALKKNAVLIKDISNSQQKSASNFVEKIFGIDLVETNGITEIVAECRKAVDNNKSVFVDYKGSSEETLEVKKFVDGLKRSFERVEVLVSLSAIHSELYNSKVVSTYQKIADGLIVSHLDLCLNFGSLFNIGERTSNLPYKFFGTGDLVPDDLESATGERILAGIFQLN